MPFRLDSRHRRSAALRFAALVPLALLLAACSAGTTGSPPAASSTPAATVIATATPSPSPTARSGLASALVTRVVDGDTIEVSIEGQTYKLRYIGVDTPETVDPRRSVGCMGKEAAQRNRELVEDRTVTLEKDISETDRYGRLLRYVWLDDPSAGQGRMVNAALVEEGFAQASAYPPDVKYADLFAALQTQAREAGRGLWGADCATPASTQAATAGPGVCEYSGTSQPLIKGNISSAGEKIYHVPGGDFYEQTVIDDSAGERWFCTEAEASAAGWRASKR
jgi:micrococcal nuclease